MQDQPLELKPPLLELCGNVVKTCRSPQAQLVHLLEESKRQLDNCPELDLDLDMKQSTELACLAASCVGTERVLRAACRSTLKCLGLTHQQDCCIDEMKLIGKAWSSLFAMKLPSDVLDATLAELDEDWLMYRLLSHEDLPKTILNMAYRTLLAKPNKPVKLVGDLSLLKDSLMIKLVQRHGRLEGKLLDACSLEVCKHFGVPTTMPDISTFTDNAKNAHKLLWMLEASWSNTSLSKTWWCMHALKRLDESSLLYRVLSEHLSKKRLK